jgi:predicted helicase
MGVDGIFKTNLNEFNAYQVKFRSGRPSLNWDELSTFMGLTDQVNQRVLFTNCDELPSVINDRTGFYCIRGSDLDKLEKRDFENIVGWLDNKHLPRAKKEPFEHQIKAVKDILSAFDKHNRATNLMACGTGKTLVALWVAEQLKCKKVLVLVPSLALLRQTLHEWFKETHWDEAAYLCVCSDPTVGKKLDEIIIRQSDLDFPVTTESKTVREFLNKQFNGVKIVFSTYQSAQVVAEGMSMAIPFELGIFDEAHKTAGREGAKFTLALKDENIAIKKRLFMTATPRHYNLSKSVYL